MARAAMVAQRTPQLKAAQKRSQRLRELPKPWPCAPTLYETPIVGSPKFQSSCILALSALGDERWDGCWRLSKAEETRLLRRIAAEKGNERGSTGFLAAMGHGDISKEQLLAFIRKEENRVAMQKLPKAVHGLLSETIVNRAFKKFDTDGNNMLDVSEWSRFLESLECLHLEFLLGQAFAAARTFYARGQPWNVGGALVAPETMKREDISLMAGSLLKGGKVNMPRCFQIGRDPDGFIPSGYLADMHYYCANNHPLYGIFACDPNNPLSPMERIAMELATIGFTTANLAYVSWGRKHFHGNGTGAALSILFSMILWWTLFLLFTCPKLGHVDLSQASSSAHKRAQMWSAVGAVLGYSLMGLWLIFLGWAVVLKATGSTAHPAIANVPFLIILEKRAKSYLFSLAIMVVLSFNPLLAWGQPDPTKKLNIGDYIGIGQWRIEKQRFQSCCAEILENSQRSHFIKACHGCVLA